MSSLSRIGRRLLLLFLISGCLADLCAQFAQQAALVGSGSVPPPLTPGCACEFFPVAQGSSVALSADGNTAIVNGPGDDNGVLGAAWIFTRSNGVWTQQGDKLIGAGAVEPVFGSIQSVALSADGNTALLGRSGDNAGVGALWVFTRTNGIWSQQGDKLVGSGSIGSGPTGPFQGAAVALSADGNTAVIDGRGDNKNTGALWVFTRANGVWSQQGDKLVGSGATGPLYQCCPAISGDGNTILFGSVQPGGTGNGFNWIFTRNNGVWSQQGGMLIGSDTGGAVHQAISSALSADGNTAIVGGYNAVAFDAYAWVFTRRTESGRSRAPVWSRANR
jgi:limonene-1,2-epoxide hydrolase